MDLNREKLYTTRWFLAEIIRKSEDPKVDSLALDAMKIVSELLVERMPEEFLPKEPDRVDDQMSSAGATKYELDKESLWIPFATVRQDLKMKTLGKYISKNGLPTGLVIHFNAGRIDKKPIENALGTISYGRESGYNFLAMDLDGKIIQTNPLNQYGYHCGKSAWNIAGKKQTYVSDRFVGVEISNPGRLSKGKDGNYYAWFDTAQKSPYKPNQVVIVPKDTDNMIAGAYLPFTKEQEKSLVELCLFLKANDPDNFDLANVVGHDELRTVFGLHGDKNDPGGCLSMTTTKFRSLLTAEYKKRYG